MRSLLDEINEKPESYYSGYSADAHVRVRNLVVFTRKTRRTLQQGSLANLSHHRHVLVWAIETSGVVSIDGIGIRLSPGQSTVILPYQFHHYVELSSPGLLWLFVTFELSEEEDALAPLSLLRFENDDVSEKLLHDFLLSWRNRRQLAGLLECQNILERILIRMLYDKDGEGLPGIAPGGHATGRDSWFARAEQALIRGVGKGLGISAVARGMGMSERFFRQRFQKVSGVTPGRYRSNYQLQQALRLIRMDELGIGAIADQLGFASAAVFTRFIKRETGKTPLECRKRIRSGRMDAVFSP